MFVKEGGLPVFADATGIRSPVDMKLAERLSVEHTDEELRKMSEETTEEFWRSHRNARLRFGPIGLLASLASMIGVLAGGLFILAASGAPPLVTFIGAAGLTVLSVKAIQERFDRLVEDRSRDALVRAHSLRLAIELRKVRRWWEAYDAAGRPPLDI